MTVYRNIIESFLDQADRHPDRPALIYLGTRYSFKKLREWAAAFAQGLGRAGIQPGDRVMIYLPNCPEWAAAWLGILMHGAAAVPLSPIYPARDLEFVARDSEAKGIVCSNANAGYVSQILPRTQLTLAVHARITDRLPLWKRVTAHLFDRHPRGRAPRSSPFVPFSRMIRQGGPPHPGPAGPKDLATILYTGGTTLTPKGVPYPHEQFLDPMAAQFKVMEPVLKPETNVILLATPLFHITGLTFCLGALGLNGETVILLPKLNPDALMDAIARERARSLFAVPSLYRILLEHDRLDMYDLSSLVYCFSGGDVFPGQIGRRWKEKFGLDIGQGYGATETGGGVSLSPPNRVNPPQAVGLPVDTKEIRIVDPQTLTPVPSGRPGELLVRSDPMITGYWNRPLETAKSFIQVDGKLWYRTGDLMRQDSEGYLYFVDRVADAIVLHGRRLSVSEIETAIQEHPAVTGACVVGVPDEKAGQRIKAFVVLKENQRGLGGQDLLHWLDGRLPAYMIPQYVEFRDTLPKSKVGKMLRRELRDEESERRTQGVWDAALKD